MAKFMEYDEYEGKSKGITAFGYYKQDGKFVVLKGSFAVGDSQLRKSFFNDPVYRGYPEKRKELIDTKKLEKKAYCYQFTEDVEFDDVSPAASIIWGSNRNGKRDFTPNGKKVRIGQNIRSVNKPTVFQTDSIKTVEAPTLVEQTVFKEENDELAFREGKKVEQLHKLIERDKAVVDLAKKKAKERDPFLCCSVCGFSFLKKYGEDFIEAHHIKPLSEITEEVETKVEDLAMVCSNCHRMLHRRKPWRSISDLQSKILNRK